MKIIVDEKIKRCSYESDSQYNTELQKHGIKSIKVKAKSGESIQCLHITSAMIVLLHCECINTHLSCPKPVWKLAWMG